LPGRTHAEGLPQEAEKNLKSQLSSVAVMEQVSLGPVRPRVHRDVAQPLPLSASLASRWPIQVSALKKDRALGSPDHVEISSG
jgi:hypothetical protein